MQKEKETAAGLSKQKLLQNYYINQININSKICRDISRSKSRSSIQQREPSFQANCSNSLVKEGRSKSRNNTKRYAKVSSDSHKRSSRRLRVHCKPQN